VSWMPALLRSAREAGYESTILRSSDGALIPVDPANPAGTSAVPASGLTLVSNIADNYNIAGSFQHLRDVQLNSGAVVSVRTEAGQRISAVSATPPTPTRPTSPPAPRDSTASASLASIRTARLTC